MKYEVYRDRDSSKVGLFKGLLESEGIDVMARNWEGSNITEIPIPSLFPYLTVYTEEDYHRAIEIIDDYENSDPSELEAWVCGKCSEKNEGVYGECWNCQEPLSYKS